MPLICCTNSKGGYPVTVHQSLGLNLYVLGSFAWCHGDLSELTSVFFIQFNNVKNIKIASCYKIQILVKHTRLQFT